MTLNTPCISSKNPRFDGSFKWALRIARLLLNLYGSAAASFIYYGGFSQHLETHGYKRSQNDPNLFYKNHDAFNYSFYRRILRPRSGSFIPRISHNRIREIPLHQIQHQMYRPSYILCKLDHHPLPGQVLYPDGSVHISQPKHILSILQSTNMLEANTRTSPLPHSRDVYE